ncbi:replication-associated protein [Sierra dome spider associated circular virus 2]|uniref:replication-associated protein n=1 Tax=Sierra dome spider associated circular virus 2 TaxID=2293300 RepID=UPI000E32FEE3|nr:replication-associated protein [Sierra dome spider associated circular virus 2]AXL65931.1 replication-associated protein [Sierra dome spider associated circular virus 2]
MCLDLLTVSNMSRCRNYVFTLNNPQGTPMFVPDKMKYMVYQKESGENGTNHYQGYVELLSPTGMPSVKRMIGQNPHLEPRRGTQAEARAYCMKPETRVDGPWEMGTFTENNQGKRTDLELAIQDIDGGSSMARVALDHPVTFVKYPRGLSAYANMRNFRGTTYTKKQSIVLWGSPGCGKTSTLVNYFPDMYVKMCDNKWWDGYSDQKQVLLDDFPNTYTAKQTKDLLGELDLPRESKGQVIKPRVEFFFITSNFHPDEWFESAKQQDRLAVRRRITKTYNFDVEEEIWEFVREFSPYNVRTQEL